MNRYRLKKDNPFLELKEGNVVVYQNNGYVYARKKIWFNKSYLKDHPEYFEILET